MTSHQLDRSIRIAGFFILIISFPLIARSQERPPLELIPQIDRIGAYSEVTEIPVDARNRGVLEALAPKVSRRITGRPGNRAPLRFALDFDARGRRGETACLVIRVDRVSAGGAALNVRVGSQEYGVQWSTAGTWVVSQNLLVPIPRKAEMCVVDATEGVVVVDAYSFYPEASELPERLPVVELVGDETLSFDANAEVSARPALDGDELSDIRLEQDSAAYYRRAYSISPHYAGMALEDIWPTHWLTVAEADSAGERIAAKAAEAPWAKAYLETLIAEAESLLNTEPQLPIERVGWRHDYFSPDTAEHLLYDPRLPNDHLDPLTGRFYSGSNLRRAWVLLTHERTFKLMRSVGLLYAATGDERYAEWVAKGMLKAADFVETAEARGWERSRFGGTAVWYQPLYDATALLGLANAYALTRDSEAYTAKAHDRIRTAIFEARIPEQIVFLRNIGGLQNMAAYAAAAVAVAGELYDREDWLSFGIGSEFGFVRWLEANVPDGAEGGPDGLWNEQTTFYHFYALAPMITLYQLADDLSPANRARFEAMFEAPLKLLVPDLELHVMGDLAAHGHFSLVDVRSFYEFAAGEISEERYGPLLAHLYAKSGLERGGLWSLLYGPPSLPEPQPLQLGHDRLEVSGYGSFRDASSAMTLGFRGGRFRGGHDHPDRLSIFLHGGAGAVAPDLGEPGYALRSETEDYFRRSISHNGLFANERDNRGSTVVDWRFDASPPRARGVIEDFKGVRYERTVYFDPPFVILVDRYEGSERHRYGWALHALGELAFLNANPSRGRAENPPFDMPPIPAKGAGYAMINDRSAAEINASLQARWALRNGHYLEAFIQSDGAFEATRARSAGNPLPEDRGALILRAPGESRTFITVLQMHTGTPDIEDVTYASGQIKLQMPNGQHRIYAWEKGLAGDTTVP